MDAMDDFEMKPITKGLGFHKKPVNLSEQTAKQDLADDVLPKTIPATPAKTMFEENTIENPLTYEDLLKSLSTTEKDRSTEALSDDLRQFDMDKSEGENLSISEPLPRKVEETRSASMEMPRIQNDFPTPMPLDDLIKDHELPVDDGLNDIPIPGVGGLRQTPVKPQSKVEVSTGTRRSSSNSPPPQLVASPICIRSILLDALIVVAVALVFLVSLLGITGVGLKSVLASVQTDISMQVPLAILYLAIYQIYVIGTRSFYGRTLGEWTFDHQLGRDTEQDDGMYPIRVVWRSIITLLTGVIVLPLLSFIVRIDLARYLSGLQLYKVR